MTRFQDYQDREARNANFEQWRERMERHTDGLTVEECEEIAKRNENKTNTKEN
jgi:hypothetical protein